MNSNVSIFNNLYNELDNLLLKTLGINDSEYIGYKDKLYKLKKGNYTISSFVNRYFDELKNFGYIRNELIHKYQNYIDITDITIKNIKKYIQIFRSPRTCYDYFKLNVYTCNEDDFLFEIIKVMKNNLFTHIPVYDKNNNFKGILTESSITYFIGNKIEKDGTLMLENIKIGDIDLDNGNDLYKFISRKTTIYEIEDMFYNTIKKNKRLGTIFITNLGKESEKIDGIITAWDIPRIKDLYL